GNRRGLYIALSAVVVLAVLVAAGFGAKRWLGSRPIEDSTTGPADNPAPAAPAPAADATASPVMPATQTVPAGDTTRSKSAIDVGTKRHTTAPQVAQNPSPPQEDAPQQDVPQ